MPVFFERGDILGFNVDAVVLPHAPSDRMPWGGYDEGDFWDIAEDVFARADKKNMIEQYNDDTNYGKGYKIGEDFIDEDDTKKGFIPDKYPVITVTEGFGLPIEHVLHVRVRLYADYLSVTGDYNACAAEEKYMLTRCYWMALHCAARLGIKKIAFPLFSTDCPKEIAYEVAHSVPQMWLNENTKHEISDDLSHESPLNRLIALQRNAEMEIYIVEPGGRDLDRMKALRDKANKPKPSEPSNPFLSQFELQLEQDVSAFGGDIEAFKLYFIQKCFEKYKRKHSFSELAKKSYYSSSDITKLKNGDTKKVNKKAKAIALAVTMELSDYDRFVFINCTGNDYPKDGMDFWVEKLISEGKRDIEELREALYKINEEYDLYEY